MGAKRDGTITAWHVKILADFGAYNMILTPLIPSLGAFVMGGCYKIPNVQTDIVGVFTNKCPTDAIRGAGRPEATQMIEVTLDQLAHELGDRPARDPPQELHPQGGLPGGGRDRRRLRLRRLPRARSTSCWSTSTSPRSAPSRQRLRSEGVYRGLGFCTWTEICGLAPSRITGPAGVGVQAGLWESAMVRVHNTGAVTVYTGTSPHGQGLDTAMAQIVADKLGVDPAVVEVIHGDTVDRARGPRHLRLAVAGDRRRGGRQVPPTRSSPRPRQIVAAELEAAAEDIEVAERQVLGQGLARQGHGARRRRRHRLHRRGPRGDGARAGGDDVLRPGELRVPVRRARLRRRRRRRRPARSR